MPAREYRRRTSRQSERRYYVYVMANLARTLYVGVTNDIQRRVFQHKQRQFAGFTAKYGLTRLVYFEETDRIQAALAREKQLKSWLRQRKIEQIESVNPAWGDLAAGWYESDQPRDKSYPKSTDSSLRSE